MRNKITFVGLGNKARNGKDATAEILEKIFISQGKSCKILHFADSLYEEVRDGTDEFPILYCHDDVFFVKDGIKWGVPTYRKLYFKDHPKIEKIMPLEGGSFVKMTEKNPELLQWWGTDYRRNLCSDDYWINALHKKSVEFNENETAKGKYGVVVIVPDTRFKNELHFIRSMKGVYCNVKRILPDGSQFIDPNRDPNHPSETDIDGQYTDYDIQAPDGGLNILTAEANKFATWLKQYL